MRGSELLWEGVGDVTQTVSKSGMALEAQLLEGVPIPFPRVVRTSEQRLDLHDLTRTRTPVRSQAWQTMASRPEAVVPLADQGGWRLGWYGPSGWVWAELHATRRQSTQQLVFSYPTGLLSLRIRRFLASPGALSSDSQLTELVAQKQAVESCLLRSIQAAEQAFIARERK